MQCRFEFDERPERLKALTVLQPWAWAIAAGHKRVENRTWATGYRGPLAIHAGKSDRMLALGREFLERRGVIVPADNDLVYGAVIAVATLVDCVPADDASSDPWAFGPWCWRLADVRALDVPVSCRGRQNLFAVELPRRA